tara:strand:- start:630 stop:923 length:294 start_codon:yes stop_codon:yes gene_type:complete
MQGTQANGSAGVDVKVFTSNNRGFTPEELAERAVEKLVSISETADPMVKAQAMVFKDEVRQLMAFYMYEAIRSYKTTLCAELTKQGRLDMAQIINKV